MPRYRIPGYQSHYRQFDEIMGKIATEVCKKEKDGINFQKIRRRSTGTTHPQYFTVNANPEDVKLMLGEITGKMLKYLRAADESNLAEIKKEIQNEIIKIEEYLLSFAGGDDKRNIGQRRLLFSQQAVNSAVNILCDDAVKRFDNQINNPKRLSPEIKEEFMINPKAYSWIEKQERPLIREIRDIFKVWIPEQKAEDQVIYFTSLVFKACGLWPGRNHYETMKNRFSALQ